MYFIKFTRSLPPFNSDSNEEIYFLGSSPERVVDALTTFGGLLTTHPNPQRDGRITDTESPGLNLPAAVQDGLREMASGGKKFWVVVVKPPKRGTAN